MAKTGSVMVCDKGTVTVPIVASGSASVKICDAFLAGVNDVAPGANISPFGICTITKSLCSPAPVGNWVNPFESACIVGNVQGLLEGAKLPCAVGGTISLMSAAQATVLVGNNLSQFTPGQLIAAWAAAALSGLPPQANKALSDLFSIDCNRFVVAAFAAAGIIIPKVKRTRWGIDIFAEDSEPVVQELIDPRLYNDLLTPPKPIAEAEVGDMILWSKGEHNHAAILTGKNGTNPDNWEVTYTAGKGALIKKNPISVVTEGEGDAVPVARGPRNS